MVKRVFLPGLFPTATITSSKISAALVIISRCPLVTGSKLPGQMAVVIPHQLHHLCTPKIRGTPRHTPAYLPAAGGRPAPEGGYAAEFPPQSVRLPPEQTTGKSALKPVAKGLL